MGIFNDPKRLAKILASVKVNYRERPLSPIQVAKELQEACKELGSNEIETQARFGIGTNMWGQFKRLSNISEDIENQVSWGESDPTSLTLGFSAASFMARFSRAEQNKLVAASWDYDKVLTNQDMKDIFTYKRENPEKTIDDAISDVFKFNHLEKEIIHMFISGLDPQIYENIKQASENQGVPLKEFTKNILNKKLSEGSVTSTNPKETFIRITFSKEGKQIFENIFQQSKISRNDFVNYLFREGGF